MVIPSKYDTMRIAMVRHSINTGDEAGDEAMEREFTTMMISGTLAI